MFTFSLSSCKTGDGMKRRFLSFVWGVPLLLLATAEGYSHPHLFMDCTIILKCENNGVQGFYLEWSFDKVFTAMVVQAYDANSDGTFDARETREVYENAFINLENYHYFTYVTQNGRRWSPQSVTEFTCRLSEEALVYRFFVPRIISVDEYPFTFKITVFDDTYFTAVTYTDDPVKRIGGSSFNLSYRIAENRDNPYYYDPYGGVNDNVDNTKPGPGLLAAFPEEVVIQLSK
jgi:ABC-type uncharacterized transport system substrate-binding protein